MVLCVGNKSARSKVSINEMTSEKHYPYDIANKTVSTSSVFSFPSSAPADSKHTRLRFGNFEIDLSCRELRKHGLRIRLAEKPFRVLELLLERPGQVVTRATLREKLWPDTHVGYDHSLNTAVNTLRELLGDTAQNPRYIETLPRLGYRFITPVVRPEAIEAAATKKALVVLPFEHLSANPDHELFADGLTDETISCVSQLDPRRLGVIARTSSIQYKRARKSILEIASELNVHWILEGTVRWSATALRITAQLIQASEQTHVWSSTFDRDLGDPLAIQSAIAREIGLALTREILVTKSTLLPAAPEPRRTSAANL
jgi:TolB-like protein